MKSNNGNNIVVFNGAIYNYKELWKNIFGDKNITPSSDTRVLVETN